MRKLMLAALPFVLAALIPATSVAKAPSRSLAHRYEREYRTAQKKFGRRAPGCDLVRRGCRARPTEARVRRSLAVLDRMVAPAPSPAVPAAPAAVPASAPAPAVAPSYSGGGGSLPACASESGTNYSTGPSNTNASSGATGRYQILPSTAAGYGCNLSTPAGQDACAQTIYRNQGAGAWVGCGG